MNTDYKHIEQLLERYWQCETSLQEEDELRAFFAYEEVPSHLLRYKELFAYQLQQQELKLSDDFEERILSQIGAPVVKARRITLTSRLVPLFKAVAMVAVVLSLGGVLQQSFLSDQDASTYTDTYTDVQIEDTTLKQVSPALMLSEGVSKSKEVASTDSLVLNVDAEAINKAKEQ